MKRGWIATGGQRLRCHHSMAQRVSETQVQGECGQVRRLPHCPVRITQGCKSGVLCAQKHHVLMSPVQP